MFYLKLIIVYCFKKYCFPQTKYKMKKDSTDGTGVLFKTQLFENKMLAVGDKNRIVVISSVWHTN